MEIRIQRPDRKNALTHGMYDALTAALIAADTDPAVRVAGGALEGSNVNAVDAMVSMIGLARSFETQMSLLKNAENNAAKASQILALN